MKTPATFAAVLALCILGSASSARAFGHEEIIEYHNSILDHYFLAVAAEAEIIDRGGAGAGWARTGKAYTVENPGYPFYGVPVCRFYGSVTPGPNSHFFTANQAECDGLKALAESLPPEVPKWHYEGIAFFGVALFDGKCALSDSQPSHSYPMYRLYNRGFERGIDSNHRYTTSRLTVEEMKAQGWVEEGIAWCVWG
ncbi:hypothetical protein BURK2_04263 [Burkholderiales bacterium]|nr:hypothetical protein BURK2_04263 [Burkholderiales bacterium]